MSRNRPIAGCGDFPGELVTRKAAIFDDVRKPWKTTSNILEYQRAAIAILDISGMDDRLDHQAKRIGQDVAFAALDLLARVIAPWAATFGRFDRLTVDNAGGRARLTALRLVHMQDQRMIDVAPQSGVSPPITSALHRRKEWKLAG